MGGGGGGGGGGGEEVRIKVMRRLGSTRRQLLRIKPHYRSEGPRQGSCGVFGGCFILSRLLLWSTQFNESKKYLRFKYN